MAARPLCKDFQNEQSAVIHWQLNMALQIPLLRRAERLVKQHFDRSMHVCQSANFIRFATANEQRGIWCFALARNARDRLHASSLGEQPQLFQLSIEMGEAEVHPHQQHRSHGGRGCGSRTQSQPPSFRFASLNKRVPPLNNNSRVAAVGIRGF